MLHTHTHTHIQAHGAWCSAQTGDSDIPSNKISLCNISTIRPGGSRFGNLFLVRTTEKWMFSMFYLPAAPADAWLSALCFIIPNMILSFHPALTCIKPSCSTKVIKKQNHSAYVQHSGSGVNVCQKPLSGLRSAWNKSRWHKVRRLQLVRLHIQWAQTSVCGGGGNKHRRQLFIQLFSSKCSVFIYLCLYLTAAGSQWDWTQAEHLVWLKKKYNLKVGLKICWKLFKVINKPWTILNWKVSSQ